MIRAALLLFFLRPALAADWVFVTQWDGLETMRPWFDHMYREYAKTIPVAEDEALQQFVARQATFTERAMATMDFHKKITHLVKDGRDDFSMHFMTKPVFLMDNITRSWSSPYFEDICDAHMEELAQEFEDLFYYLVQHGRSNEKKFFGKLSVLHAEASLEPIQFDNVGMGRMMVKDNFKKGSIYQYLEEMSLNNYFKDDNLWQRKAKFWKTVERIQNMSGLLGRQFHYTMIEVENDLKKIDKAAETMDLPEDYINQLKVNIMLIAQVVQMEYSAWMRIGEPFARFHARPVSVSKV